MPELPEVEIVRRGLEPVMRGRLIHCVEQRRRDLRFPLPQRFAERLAGDRIEALERRAKYIIARLRGGDALIMHLGMTGRFSVAHAKVAARRKLASSASSQSAVLGEYVYDAGADPAHDHVVFHMEHGTTITYNDPRRFGFMLLVPLGELDGHPLIRTLGVEPLGNEFSAAHLASKAKGRRSDLKSFVMDQRVVAGLGNIYACEALFRARLSPWRRTSSLVTVKGQPTDRAGRLVAAIRSVLIEALDAGGSTLRDYRQADGAPGAFQEAHAVYDRDGLPCMRSGCTGTVRRRVQASRSTFYCGSCQR